MPGDAAEQHGNKVLAQAAQVNIPRR